MCNFRTTAALISTQNGQPNKGTGVAQRLLQFLPNPLATICSKYLVALLLIEILALKQSRTVTIISFPNALHYFLLLLLLLSLSSAPPCLVFANLDVYDVCLLASRSITIGEITIYQTTIPRFQMVVWQNSESLATSAGREAGAPSRVRWWPIALGRRVR